eukprot:GHVL01040362.1.p1 GENE.GHVL01040362.1~~GHVL01040362.1.p1  ORF type:complete len:107 (+),score=23.78 GHVL01040362.1:428-748(+)
MIVIIVVMTEEMIVAPTAIIPPHKQEEDLQVMVVSITVYHPEVGPLHPEKMTEDPEEIVEDLSLKTRGGEMLVINSFLSSNQSGRSTDMRIIVDISVYIYIKKKNI